MAVTNGPNNLPKLLSVGEASPKYCFTSKTFERLYLSEEFGYPDATKEWLKKIINISTIETVPCVIDPEQFFRPAERYDPKTPVDEYNLFSRAEKKWRPTPEERFRVYQKFAGPLSIDAAKDAIEKWGGDMQKINYVITNTSSGFRMPGLDLEVCDALESKNIKHRVCVDNTGCFGSFSALKVAQTFCQADPGSYAIVICTEVCSVHLQQKAMDRGYVLGNVLFGDGSTAAILGPGKPSDWQMTDIDMFTMPPFSRDYVTVEMTDDGYLLYLGKELPPSINQFVTANWKSMIQKSLQIENPDDCEWCVHPGGKAVVLAVQGIKELNLDEHKLRFSWESLRTHGNLAAPSILLVLMNLMKHAAKDKIFVVGFGPGMVLKCYGLTRNTHSCCCGDSCMCGASCTCGGK